MNGALRGSEGLGVTEGIHRSVDLARKAVRGYGNTQVDTEHLLLGLLEEPEGGAAQVLSDLGMDRAQARQTVMRMLGIGE